MQKSKSDCLRSFSETAEGDVYWFVVGLLNLEKSSPVLNLIHVRRFLLCVFASDKCEGMPSLLEELL
jgi:hypothetical protein